MYIYIYIYIYIYVYIYIYIYIYIVRERERNIVVLVHSGLIQAELNERRRSSVGPDGLTCAGIVSCAQSPY